MSIRGCYGSTVTDAISNALTATSDDATLPLSGGTGFTPTYANSLVLSLLGTDTGLGPFCLPGWEHLFGGDTAANSLAVSYTFQRTTASLTHPGYWGGTQDDSRWALLAIRDDGNGQIPAYVDRGTAPSYLLAPLVMLATADKGTWELNTNDITSVTLTNGGATKTLTQVDPTATADCGYNPFNAAAKVTAASNKTNVYASQLRRTAVDDLTVGNGVIFGTWRPTVPRDYLDMGKVVAGGMDIMIADASNNYRMWCIGAQLSKTTKTSDRQNYNIEVASEDTDWAESATNPTLSAIEDWYLCGSGYFGAMAAEWSGLYLLNNFVIAGGSSTVPMTLDDVISAVNNGGGYMPFIEKAGAAGTVWVPLQFGGGEACHTGINLGVIQFPRKADGVDYLDSHISNNKHGVEFYGQDRGSGDVDTLSFTNTVFTSETPFYWRFNASHAAGASIDFSGATVVMATVTLRSTVSLSEVAFIDCPSFTQNSAVLASCSIDGTTVLSGAPNNISDCNFSCSAEHGIEITTSGTYSFSGNQFSGYGADGTTTAAVYNNSGGAVTLTIVGGGGTPTVRNGTGASTTIIAGSVTTTVTVTTDTGTPISSAAVALYAKDATGNLPYQETVTITNSGTTATVAHTAHGMLTNDKVLINGASLDANNGVYAITVTSADQYTYTMGSAPGSNPTGTITSTWTALYGTTDADGQIGQISMSRVFSVDQPVSGWARKSTSAPYYKTGPISGTIDSGTGASLTALLLSDE
jgi:hypothetical protein